MKKEILEALDNTTPYTTFLDLEHGYFHTAGSRINLYADENRWAIVFEKSGYGNRSGVVELELNYYGNCLSNLEGAGQNDQYISNSKYFPLISAEELERVEGDFERVAKNAKHIKVRNTILPIEQDLSKYKAHNIEIEDFDNPDHLIDFASLVRYLDEDDVEDLFRATGTELRTCIPNDLPLLLKIDHWHHKSFSEWGGEAPSSYETFQLIADILTTKDVTKWKPTLMSNNDWRNWPEAGGL